MYLEIDHIGRNHFSKPLSSLIGYILQQLNGFENKCICFLFKYFLKDEHQWITP